MNYAINQNGLFYWLSKLGGVAIAFFFAVFATTPPLGFMQLVPSLIIVFVIIVAWKNDLFGFIGFLILGIAATLFFSTYEKIINFLLISLPLFIVSVLYLKSFFDRKSKTTTT
jgi:fructose-specific phosphotransferase system IIC component